MLSLHNKAHRASIAWAGLVLLALLLSACVGPTAQASTPTLPQPSATPAAATPTQPVPTTAPTLAATETPIVIVSPSPSETSTAPAGSAASLVQIQMIDPTTGWGLTDSGVVRTTDGGASWTTVTPPNLQNAQARPGTFFLDGQHAWLVIMDASNPNQGALYQTSDGGQTWQQFSVPFAMGTLQFLNPTDGWMLAGRGAAAGSEAVDIYHSTDGGQTWTKVYGIDPQNPPQSGGIPFAGDKTGMTFLNNQVGWVTGSEPMEGYVYLFKTTDGGQTWQHVNLNIPSGYANAMIPTYPPRFFNDQQGVLPVVLFTQSGALDFYTTQDGGQTWSSTTVQSLYGSYSIISPQDFMVWDGGPTLQWTHDGGQTWTGITPNINLSQNLAQIDFVNPQVGWVIATNTQLQYQLYKTTDGGQTWQQQ